MRYFSLILLAAFSLLTFAACEDPNFGDDDDSSGVIDFGDQGGQPPQNLGYEVCGDGYDNDGDGLFDCDDPDCASSSVCITPSEAGWCNNGKDDDGDGWFDCADPDCYGAPECQNDPPPSSTEWNCVDGIDNDTDGLVDCADSDCVGYAGCDDEEDPTPPDNGVDEICDNGYDDDGDGYADCDDSECEWDADCDDTGYGVLSQNASIAFVKSGTGTADTMYVFVAVNYSFWTYTDTVYNRSTYQVDLGEVLQGTGIAPDEVYTLHLGVNWVDNGVDHWTCTNNAPAWGTWTVSDGGYSYPLSTEYNGQPAPFDCDIVGQFN